MVALEDLWPSRSGGPTPCSTTGPCRKRLPPGLAFANDASPRPEGRSGGRFHRARRCWWRPSWPPSDRDHAPRPTPRQDAIPFAASDPAPVHGHPARQPAHPLSKGPLEAGVATLPAPAGSLRRGDPDSMGAVEVARPPRQMAGRGLRVPWPSPWATATADETSLDHHHVAGGLDSRAARACSIRPSLRRSGPWSVFLCYQAEDHVKMITPVDAPGTTGLWAIARQMALYRPG